MRILPAIIFCLALPAAAMAQPQYYPGNPMTEPVTPRDVAWYMARPNVMRQTLTICHSNAAYGPTADCQNAERAADGLMARQHSVAAAKGVALYQDPAYWSANPINRGGVLAQCRRRGPGDELMFPYCKAAAASALNDLSGNR